MDFITDTHLNLFRFFSESNDPHYIENNLSQAFAICLRNDLPLFTEYMREILRTEDYEYLFSHYESESKYLVDLQINTSEIEVSGLKAIYAVAMTGNQQLSMADFLDLQPRADKEKNITDIWILIKDIIIVIEVKRTWEDCKQQLYNRIYPLISKNDKIRVEPKNFSWPDTLRIMERISNIRQMRQDTLSYVTDFLTLCEAKYPDWFPTQPFYNLPAIAENSRKRLSPATNGFDRSSSNRVSRFWGITTGSLFPVNSRGQVRSSPISKIYTVSIISRS